jgi:segregation and condensation protein A
MKLCINDFEGPLDLLLHLVKTAKMDIYEIDTKYIIDKYLEFIKSIPNDDLDNASEYLVMASELIHLKSRLLLNLKDESSTDEDEYSINSEEDLKNKLIEYEKYQNITSVFKELEEKRNEFFTKLPENLSEFADKKEVLEGNMDAELLKQALIELQKRMNYQKPINTKITRKEISVEERKEYIRNYLAKRKNVKFTDLFEEYTKDLVVATFLSILDMCKQKEITLKQDSNFGEIYIERVNV